MEATLEAGGDWSARHIPPSKTKKPEGENRLDHGPKTPTWRTTVPNLEFKPRPLVIFAGAPSSHREHFFFFP
jgi:hypothetical protein